MVVHGVDWGLFWYSGGFLPITSFLPERVVVRFFAEGSLVTGAGVIFRFFI